MYFAMYYRKTHKIKNMEGRQLLWLIFFFLKYGMLADVFFFLIEEF